YAQAVFFLQSRKKHNIPQALSVFFQQFAGAKWHLMAATAIIAIIPVIVVFLVFQRQFIKGLSEGAIKG
ncbi:MAG: carbohydrate ABC transporter permease, partial [Lachnospiraceae bacterium]|nr:carbohydrate ABC transporter permease [Lachnospiraceae bacterium]